MNEWRVVKKYPNRRLYDTNESRYVTLADIRRLVLEQIPFKVIDKTSQQDITRNILLQVISEQENAAPLLTRELLAALIRCQSLDAGALRPALEDAARLLGQLQPALANPAHPQA
jgi:polyhydroxyalkanoate synthesis repressor PhaR